MQLPIYKSSDTTLMLLQNNWARTLNPVLGNPLNSVQVLKNVVLASGTNVINHLLGQQQQGWFLVDKQGAAEIYRSEPFNDLTLTLHSNASVTVSIGVY